jgi:hypothetical protein
MTRQPIAGRFEVGRHLGRGGMGEVHEAWDRVREQQVALKVLGSRQAPERLRFTLQQEFSALQRLRHPGVPVVHDFGWLDDGRPWFTMDLIEGSDLAELLPLPLAEFYRVFIELSQTLAFVHSRRVLHRDLKARNVRVRRSQDGAIEQVVLLDFGLVSSVDARAVDRAGTPGHLPPELDRGAPSSLRADLYSLGVLMVQALTGRLPRRLRVGGHAGGSPLDLLALEGLDSELQRLICSLVADSPALRPTSARAVLDELMRLSELRPLRGLEQGDSYLSEPVLVGRQRQLEQMRSLAGRCQDGSLDVLVVWGEAGCGADLLTREVALELQAQGAEVLRGRCRAEDGPLAAVLRALEPPLLAELEAGRTTPAPVFVRASARLASRLPQVQPVGPTEDPYREPLRLLEACESWLRRLAGERLVVLALEDLQLADSRSLDLVDRLLEARGEGTRLLILATSVGRPELLQRHVGAELRLGPLGALGVDELLRVQLGLEGAPDELIRALLGSTGGNVRALHELLRDLVDRGELRFRGGRWQLPARLDELPDVRAGLHAQRLERCPTRALELLHLLALLNRPVEPELLGKLAGEAGGEAVRALVEADLVRSREGAVEPPDPAVVALLAERCPKPRLEQLHGRLAEALALLEVQDPAELGRHLQLAGRSRAALELLVPAGDRAFERQAGPEAVRLLGWARELLLAQPYVPGGELDRVEDRLIRLLFTLDPGRCAELAEGARARLLRLGWFSRIPRLRGWLGRGAVPLSLVVTWLTALRPAGLSWPRARELYGSLLLAGAFKAASVGWTGRFAESHRLARQDALPLVPRMDSMAGALFDVMRSIALVHQGHHGALELRLTRARELLLGEAGRDLRPYDLALAVRGGADIALAGSLAQRGLPEALEPLTAPLGRGDQVQSLFLDASRVLATSCFHALRGQLVELEAELDHLRACRVSLRPQTSETIQRQLIWACIEAGDLDRARRLLPGIRHMGGFSEAQRCLLEARMPGSVERRLELIRRARGLLEQPQVDAPLHALRARWIEAELELERARPGPALELLDQVLDQARQPAHPAEYEHAVASRLRARALFELGRASEASRQAREALEQAVALDNPLLEALSRVELARLERDRGELERALHGLRRLGNHHQVELLSGLLGETPGRQESGSLEVLRRLGWSLELSDVLQGVLEELDERLPATTRTLVLLATEDFDEVVASQRPGGAPVLDAGLGPSARRALSSLEGLGDLQQLDEGWFLPLRRPLHPGAGALGEAFGALLVRAEDGCRLSLSSLRAQVGAVALLAGPLFGALQHRRLVQRQARVSLLHQLAQGLLRAGGRRELDGLLLEGLLELSGAERALLVGLDGAPSVRRGEVDLERARPLLEQCERQARVLRWELPSGPTLLAVPVVSPPEPVDLRPAPEDSLDLSTLGPALRPSGQHALALIELSAEAPRSGGLEPLLAQLGQAGGLAIELLARRPD